MVSKKKAVENKVLEHHRELYKEDNIFALRDELQEEDVKLQLQISARVKLVGKVTGKNYMWPKAGSIVPVSTQDADELLQKKLGTKPCCGGKVNYLFVKVE